MPKRMTVVFHDEELYTDLKVEAARRHTPASEIVSAAVREWLEQKEDAELLPLAEKALAEYRANGGIPWGQVKAEIDTIRQEPKH
jgi:hypothetical protein